MRKPALSKQPGIAGGAELEKSRDSQHSHLLWLRRAEVMVRQHLHGAVAKLNYKSHHICPSQPGLLKLCKCRQSS